MKDYLKNTLAFLLTVTLIVTTVQTSFGRPIIITLQPNDGTSMTDAIQAAINKCSEAGEGIVRFLPGSYLTGSLQMKSNVSLQLAKGAIIKGSDKYTDYKNDAFIYGTGLSNIAITGPGVIDGVDCYNPNGEEGFRGPHCIRLVNCNNITLKGFTIKNAANWAINYRYYSYAIVDKVSIRGGHDGLHTRFCNNFKVNECDFRTGDDAFAGNDNRDFIITNCKINTSCNGFRIGCYNFTVKHCKFWGPGEYMHKIQKRSNMLAAFVHFSPKDKNPKLRSGKWLIDNITIDNVDRVYVYNHLNGLWQTGQPVTSVRFQGVRATGILNAFTITGDTGDQFNMSIQNSSFIFREGSAFNGDFFEGAKDLSKAFFNVKNFDQIVLNKVTLQKSGSDPLLQIASGNSLTLERINFITSRGTTQYLFQNIKDIKKGNINMGYTSRSK